MALPRTFDPIFRRYRGRVPMNFMRALTQRESSFNPNDSSGPAWGLMQVVEVLRKEWNSNHPSEAVSREGLLNPDANVKIASNLLNRIVAAYGKHPDRNMKEDWSNPEFVKLVVAGWNSGYSEGGGVGKVARHLESRGIPVTHDNVFAHSQAAGATSHLANPQKQAWQRSVTDLYFAEGGAGFPFFKIGATIALAYGLYKLME